MSKLPSATPYVPKKFEDTAAIGYQIWLDAGKRLAEQYRDGLMPPIRGFSGIDLKRKWKVEGVR